MDVDSLNLVLIFGLALSIPSAVHLIIVFKSRRITLQGTIGAVTAFILGAGIVFSEIGML